VSLAISRLGAPKSESRTGDTELARALNLGPNGRDRVKQWREGRSDPNYEATLALLELVGALNVDALRKEAVLERAEELKGRVRDARSGPARPKAADA
jgi:hypothetical protein